jgi:hypothetical protein
MAFTPTTLRVNRKSGLVRGVGGKNLKCVI